jgi:hypothetical protein
MKATKNQNICRKEGFLLVSLDGYDGHRLVNGDFNNEGIIRKKPIILRLATQNNGMYVTLILLYTERWTLTLWSMNTNNTHLSNKTSVRLQRALIGLLKKAVPLHATKVLGGRGSIAPTPSRPRH